MKAFIPLFLVLLLLPAVQASPCDSAEYSDPASWSPCFGSALLGWVLSAFSEFIQQFETILVLLMTLGVDLRAIAHIWIVVDSIASVLVVCMIVYSGYLWLGSSVNEEHRARAKEQLHNLFYVLLALHLGAFALAALLQFSQGMTLFLWGVFGEVQLDAPAAPDALSPLLYVLAVVIFGIPFIVRLVVRNIVVLALSGLFPVLVVLYFFLPTRKFASRALSALMINLFFPVVWVVVLGLGNVLVSLITSSIPGLGSLFVHALVLSGMFYACSWLYKQYGFGFEVGDILHQPTVVVQRVREVVRSMPKNDGKSELSHSQRMLLRFDRVRNS